MATKLFKLNRLSVGLLMGKRLFSQENKLNFKKNSKSLNIKPFCFASLLIPFAIKSQTTRMSNVETADSLFLNNKLNECVDVLKELDNSDIEVKWRLGRALYLLSEVESGDVKQKLVLEAFQYTKDALECDEKHFAANTWYAIVLDAKSFLSGLKERIKNLALFEKHLKMSKTLNPQDPVSHYVLGSYYYALADIPWWQSKIMSTIFDNPPTSTFECALEHCLKAEQLDLKYFQTVNWLVIGKAYERLKDNTKAKEYYSKAISSDPGFEAGRKAVQEAEKLLKRIK